MKHLLPYLLLLLPFLGNTQTFHKIYFFEDSIVSIPNVFPTDSGYYFIATEGNTTNNLYETLFGKLDLEGNVLEYVRNVDTLTNQTVMWHRSELEQNSNGDFGFSDKFRAIPRLLIYSPELSEVLDTSYINMHSVDSIRTYAHNKAVLSFDKNSYYLVYNYYDELNDDNTAVGNPGETGVQVTKHTLEGEIIWQKRFAHPSSVNYKPSQTNMSFKVTSDSTLLLIARQRKNYNVPNEGDNFARILFFELDTAGNTLNQHTYDPIQNNYGWGGALKTDSNLLVTSFSGNYRPHPDTNITSYYWQYYAVITSFNNDYEVQWLDTINQKSVPVLSEYHCEELIQNSDSTFAGVFTHFKVVKDLEAEPPIYFALHPIELFNRKLSDGEIVWRRRFRYFPEDSARRHVHQMFDIDLTPDGGYVMSGEVFSADSLQAGRPSKYGYIAKTNCLGFFGAPQAEASYQNVGNQGVLFTNESIQAGGYLWVFGDGDTLSIGEEPRAVEHVYPMEGFYEVELIAYGCDGESDTLRFEIEVEKEETPPITVGDGSLLTIAPNPVQSGKALSFYVGNIESPSTLKIADNRGAVVGEYLIPDGNTQYFLPIRLASGMYHIALNSEKEVLEVEKLVVK